MYIAMPCTVIVINISHNVDSKLCNFTTTYYSWLIANYFEGRARPPITIIISGARPDSYPTRARAAGAIRARDVDMIIYILYIYMAHGDRESADRAASHVDVSAFPVRFMISWIVSFLISFPDPHHARGEWFGAGDIGSLVPRPCRTAMSPDPFLLLILGVGSGLGIWDGVVRACACNRYRPSSKLHVVPARPFPGWHAGPRR